MQKSKVWLSWVLPGLMLIVGIGISVGLQVYSRDGVFFSGDAGLKALLAQQFSARPWHVALDMPQPAWVLTLWRQGLYPFAPPYTYEHQGNYFITFPFTFPAITAPFYALMGYHGLYVVPLVSLWITWWRFLRVCRVWQLRSMYIALSLGLVILASPLTLYGAMYWEHTLAIALAFWGLSGLMYHVLSEHSHRISLNEALVNGVCVGLSGWFRPEFLWLSVILGSVAIASQVPQLPKRLHVLVPRGLTRGIVVTFTGAMGLTVLGFLGVNWVAYGYSLGIYALRTGATGQSILANYAEMVVSLLRYFPAVLLAMGLPWLMQGRARAAALMLMAMGVLYAIVIPLIAPSAMGIKQWGPRLYLILVPMVGLVIAAGLQNLGTVKRKRWSLLGAISIVFAVGFHTNLVNGGLQVYQDTQTNSISLPSNHAPIAPAITALASYDEPWVAMSHQAVAQQLWPSVQHKTFFRTETDEALEQLATELANQNESSFLYICYPEVPCAIPHPGILRPNGTANVSVSFKSLGTFGKYPFYRGLIHDN